MTNFQTMALPEALKRSLQNMQFSTPTPIQAQVIPLALEGKDILGSAQTGTGKTGAFGIPLVAHLLNNPKSSALVLTPTRELASQVLTQLQAMVGRESNIKSALLIGGDSMTKQLSQLRNRPRLIVGTPGRINDFLEQGQLKLNNTDFLVLDETDRMLDIGFQEQIENILTYMTEKPRQTLLFSATLPKNIIHISAQYLKNPERVSVDNTQAPAANIKQDILRVSQEEKYPSLLNQLNERTGSVIIFVKTQRCTENIAGKLAKEGHSTEAIHGGLRQHKRDRVILGFRKKKYRILVATDVAARGLDIPHIEHVINYDLPQCPEDYIHRIGRTARAGATGSALCILTPADKMKWYGIDRLLNPNSHQAPPKREANSNGPSRKRPNNRFSKPKTAGSSWKYESKPSSGGKPFSAANNKRKQGGKPNSPKPFSKTRRAA